MHALSLVYGIAMLVLTGTAVVLGLVSLVLFQVRWIVRNSRKITSPEPMPRQHFADVPPQRALDNHWQN